MASKKISQLTPVTPLLTDLVPLDRPTTGPGAPVTGHATLADIQALIDTGGGGGGNEYWESTVAGEIFATGSLVSITGSLQAQFLSSSNGLQITGSFTHGTNVNASSTISHAQGDSTTASGPYSHAEGGYTTSSGNYSHAEGYQTTASGIYAHAEGFNNTASGEFSHAEGSSSTAAGEGSHAEGGLTNAGGLGSHSEGYITSAPGNYSHAEGAFTTTDGNISHAEGFSTNAAGTYTHAEGAYTIADGITSHAEGWGSATHLRGFTVVNVVIDGVDPEHAVFELDSAYGDITADIQSTTNFTSLMVTDGDIAGGFIGDRRVYDFVGTNFESPSTWITCSNPYGMNPQSPSPYAGSIIASLAPLEWQLSNLTTPPDQAITGTISHAEGIESIAIGSGSHAEGFRTLAIGVSKNLTFSNLPGDPTWGAHAEGLGTIAYGNASHAEGDGTLASGDASHAEGDITLASGDSSHAEGYGTTASGNYSHAEGRGTAAVGYASHAEGQETIASGSYQHVQGKFNLRNNDFSIFVIGNGTADDDANRSDVVRVNLGSPGSGIVEVTGSLVVSGTGTSTFTAYSGVRYFPDIVTSLPFTASLTDYIIAVSSSNPLAATNYGIELPGAEFGRTFVVKDISGSAASSNITVTAAGSTAIQRSIDGASNYVLSINRGSATFVYFGDTRGWGVI